MTTQNASEERTPSILMQLLYAILATASLFFCGVFAQIIASTNTAENDILFGLIVCAVIGAVSLTGLIRN